MLSVYALQNWILLHFCRLPPPPQFIICRRRNRFISQEAHFFMLYSTSHFILVELEWNSFLWYCDLKQASCSNCWRCGREELNWLDTNPSQRLCTHHKSNVDYCVIKRKVSVVRNWQPEILRPKEIWIFTMSESKSKSHYDRQSVGQSVLVSGAHLGPATNFSISLRFSFRQLLFVVL
jgi:hypothetical protein